MEFELIDRSGKSLETFETPKMAVDAYHKMVADDPSAADDVAILELDDEGHAVGRLDTEIVASPFRR